ncbi:MAG: YkgJ family cysteine cluster protein [Desulfobacter sp.]|nr:YkgJ family cysteine cluster protein [Desulfobacter sp.]
MPLNKELDLTDFHCIQCHACCRESGYVRLGPEEPDAIAQYLGLDVHTFTNTYTRLTRDRQTLSLIEQTDGACIFLTDKGCKIQPVKPVQCENFPHKWKFSNFENICEWAKQQRQNKNHMPRIPNPSSSSK